MVAAGSKDAAIPLEKGVSGPNSGLQPPDGDDPHPGRSRRHPDGRGSREHGDVSYLDRGVAAELATVASRLGRIPILQGDKPEEMGKFAAGVGEVAAPTGATPGKAVKTPIWIGRSPWRTK
ncbi:MAG TPA: hypothetical protein VN493_08885 [Thermoanaerobaculia bacterium]|nr:hypothetical protein [Thermoanaerobaculia bacterium]